MKLNLTKNLIVLDLETTGLSITKDKIIQIALYKIFADGRPSELKKRYINPGCPIPAEVIEITGITDDMVKNEKPFRAYAKGISEFIGDADLATFNGNRFDIPLLMEHFYLAGLEFDMSNRRCIDVKRIFHQMERRDLKAAYKFYTGKDMDGAHDAGNDCLATAEVLENMLDRYKGVDYIDKHDVIIPEPVKNDMQALHEFTKDFDAIDFMGTMKYNKEGIPVFNFGKYQNQPVVKVVMEDQKYYDWIMSKGEFTRETRKILSDMVTKHQHDMKLISEGKNPADAVLNAQV
jgi:DNA polymerase-3 subunit epsilon